MRNSRLNHSLRGQATAYGRGLSLAQARASYAMEIVERASAYVSVGPGQAGIGGEVLDRKLPLLLIKARYADLKAQGRAVLDPGLLPLEASCPDAPLYWLTARAVDGAEVLVPAQAVFLFCNLDEPGLFLAGGSTGLASGNSLDEAKVAAITEILERDAEATTPFSRARCFTLRSRDQRIQSLLEDYAARGIRVQFQDLTTELGLPVYQCFVTALDGTVARATGANLNGARAALAALTETPWPYVWARPPLSAKHRARPGGVARARVGRSAGLQPAVGRGQSALAGKRAGRARQKPALCGSDPDGSEPARGPRSDSGSGAYRGMGQFFAAEPPAFCALCGHV